MDARAKYYSTGLTTRSTLPSSHPPTCSERPSETHERTSPPRRRPRVAGGRLVDRRMVAVVSETPWIANVGEGAVEHAPSRMPLGLAPRGRLGAGMGYDVIWTVVPPNDRPTVCVSITEPNRAQ